MSKRQSEKKAMSHDNCIVIERLKLRPSAKASVIVRNKYEKGKKFEKIPILRGYIMKEVKPESEKI